MIKTLLKINLKGTNNKKHIVMLVIISIMITYIKLCVLNISHLESFYMGDVIILAFGGLPSKFNIAESFTEFILWITPNILIIYLINIDIVHKIRETAFLILPRVKKKSNWVIAYNIAVYIIVIKYYLILFISSLITIFFRQGFSAFLIIKILPNNYNQLASNANQYLLLIDAFLLSTFTMICLISFINNIYHIFFNSSNAAIFCMIICFGTAITTSIGKISCFILINQSMLIRHDLFKNGFKGFNLTFSFLYLCVFFIINFILDILMVKKREIIYI